jgi:hypothetical protein
MSPPIRCLVLGALLLLNSLPVGAATVLLLGLPGRVESTPAIPAVFGHREHQFNLEIDDATAQSGALSAELFQVSGDLAVPLGAAIPLQDTLALTGAHSQRLRITLKFPDVKRRAEILARISLTQPASPATPIRLGEVRFEVFPATITKEITDLLHPGADGSTPIVLFGAGRKLHQFLSSIHLPFDDAGTAMPERFEPNRLYFGEATTTDSLQPTQDMSATRTVIFSPDESLPPGVYIEQKSPGVLIRVTLPLLDNLIDDPRAQLALIKIIHLLTS